MSYRLNVGTNDNILRQTANVGVNSAIYENSVYLGITALAAVSAQPPFSIGAHHETV